MKTGIGEAFLEVTHTDTCIDFNANRIMWFSVLFGLTTLQNFSSRSDQQTLQQKLFHVAEKSDF